MAAILSFDELTSREIAALAENIGQTPEAFVEAFARDIHRAIRERDGLEAIEAENAARRNKTNGKAETTEQ